MARSGRAAVATDDAESTAVSPYEVVETGGESNGGEESLASFFRKYFEENPKQVWQRSNEPALGHWLENNPGYTEVPRRIKINLANVKSLLRKKNPRPGRRGKTRKTEQGAEAMNSTRTTARAASELEQLEEQIDECLTLAKNLDREGLEKVIAYLRDARNQVVVRHGK